MLASESYEDERAQDARMSLLDAVKGATCCGMGVRAPSFGLVHPRGVTRRGTKLHIRY